VRLKCLVPRCENYGVNLMCPPFTPPPQEFRTILSRYSYALLVAVEHIDPPHPSKNSKEEVVNELAKSSRVLSDIMLMLEREALRMGYRFAAGLTGGECMFCDSCVGLGGRCKHPFKARPSMEAMGIDVVATLKNAGVELNFPVEDRLTWWGLLLFD
jgi:predicted metal-binding protein